MRNPPTAKHGCGAPRNVGIKGSVGKYISILDMDDMWEPTYLEKVVWFLETHPHISMCEGHFVGIGHTKNRWELGFSKANNMLDVNVFNIAMTVRKSDMSDRITGELLFFDESLEAGYVAKFLLFPLNSI